MSKWTPPERWAYQVAKDVVSHNGCQGISREDAVHNVVMFVTKYSPDSESLAAVLENLIEHKWQDEHTIWQEFNTGENFQETQELTNARAVLAAHRADHPKHSHTIPYQEQVR